MKKEKYYRITDDTSSMVPYVLFGIVAFIVIFFPFFAVNMRFQLGAIFLKIFDTIGVFSITIGSALVLVSVLSLFARGGLKTRSLMIGIALLWVGSWCTGVAINLFGFSVGQEPHPPGYF